MYHEPYHVGMYSNSRYSAVKGEVSSPDYAGELDLINWRVPQRELLSLFSDRIDVQSCEYAVPSHHLGEQPMETPPPPFATGRRPYSFLPGPPHTQPPTEQFYAATEIVTVSVQFQWLNQRLPHNVELETFCGDLYDSVTTAGF